MSKILKFSCAVTFPVRLLLRLLGSAGIAVILVLIPVLLLAALTFNTLTVALVWNVFSIHSMFGAGSLSFTQCIVVGAALMCFGV